MAPYFAIAAAAVAVASAIFGAVSSSSAASAAAEAQSAQNRTAVQLAKYRAQQQSLVLDLQQMMFWNQHEVKMGQYKLAMIQQEGAEAAVELNYLDAEMMADQIKWRGEAEANNIRRAADAVAAGQVVGYHKSGVTLAGSPNLVMRASYAAAEEDANYVLQASSLEALRTRSQGALNRLAGEYQAMEIGMGGIVARNEATNFKIQARQTDWARDAVLRGTAIDEYSANMSNFQSSLDVWRTRMSGAQSVVGSLGKLAGAYGSGGGGYNANGFVFNSYGGGDW